MQLCDRRKELEEGIVRCRRKSVPSQSKSGQIESRKPEGVLGAAGEADSRESPSARSPPTTDPGEALPDERAACAARVDRRSKRAT